MVDVGLVEDTWGLLVVADTKDTVGEVVAGQNISIVSS